jgi:acetoin utilization protein AcuC
MFDAAVLSTGASLVAATLVANRQVDVAFNISGGLHHAAPDHASGFCVFNDPAIAIKYLLSCGLRVAYVDIDAHHGDGVQQAFYDDDRVLTISLHESGQFLFPGTGFVSEMGASKGMGYSVNLPLYPYTDDEIYLWAFREVVPPLLRAFAPDVLVTQLGIDSYHSDPLTHLQLTSRGYVETVRELAQLDIPWLALGGGGYDLSAVARCWTLAYGVMLDVEWPDQIPSAFQQQHGVSHLRDTEAPEIPVDIQHKARGLAEEGVAALKRNLFPLHHLTG